MKYPTTDVEHLRHKFQTRNTWSFLFLLFIYFFLFLENAFSCRENYMCHVYLTEFYMNIAIVWYRILANLYYEDNYHTVNSEDSGVFNP